MLGWSGKDRSPGLRPNELAQQAGVSRAAIWGRIEELRSLGYEIEASPHLGYRLLSAPDLLHADDLMARLGKTKVIGRDIRCDPIPPSYPIRQA